MSVQQFQVVGNGFRGATGHIRFVVNALDGDTVVVNTPNGVRTYEFDTGGVVVAGNLLITILGTVAQTAASLRAAIIGAQGNPDVRASLGQITNIAAGALQVVDLKVNSPASGALTLTESTGGARLVVQDNADESTRARVETRTLRRVITAEDVNRGGGAGGIVLVFDFGFAEISAYSVDVWTAEAGGGAAANATRIAWNGASQVVVTDGIARLVLDGSGATDIVAGHTVFVTATGSMPQDAQSA